MKDMKVNSRRNKTLAVLVLLGFIAAPVFGGAPTVASVSKEVKAALKSRDSQKLAVALQKMAGVGGKAGMSSLLKITGKYRKALENSQYWQIVGSMAAFRDRSALEELGDYIVKKKKSPLSRDLLFALQNNDSPKVIAVHALVLEKGSFDQKLLSVDQLAKFRRVEAGDLLVKILKEEESEQLKKRALNSFATITGKNLGEVANYIGWWESNRDKNPFASADDAEEGFSGGTVERGASDPRSREMSTFEGLEKAGAKALVIVGGACCVNSKRNMSHNFDHIEEVLRSIGIKTDTKNKQEFAKMTQADLKSYIAIAINCTQNNQHCICPTCKPTGATNMRMQTCGGCDKHILVKDSMPEAGIQLIKNFVEGGGYFFSEDWGLYEIIGKAWPKIVKVGTFFRDADKAPKDPNKPPKRDANGKKERDQVALPPGNTVKVTPAPGATSHPYMRGVFLKPKSDRVQADDEIEEGGTVERGGGQVGSEFMAPEHEWTIDDDSPSIRVVDKRRVRILLESDELRKLAKGDSAAAFMFPVGRAKGRTGPGARPTTGTSKKGENQVSVEEAQPGGRVLHVLSHFGKQQSAVDEAALRNLLVNFMLECARRHGYR